MIEKIDRYYLEITSIDKLKDKQKPIDNLKIDFLYRKLDQYSWQYCNKGFFNFKNYIPKIIVTFN